MKRLMAAALAATLMCGGAAFAQDNMQPGAQPAPAQPSGAAQPAAPAAPADAGQPAAPMAAAPADASAGNVVSNAPAGQPPSQYPPCTHKGEDRCVARAGMSGKHHKKTKTSEATASAAAGN